MGFGGAEGYEGIRAVREAPSNLPPPSLGFTGTSWSPPKGSPEAGPAPSTLWGSLLATDPRVIPPQGNPYVFDCIFPPPPPRSRSPTPVPCRW